MDARRERRQRDCWMGMEDGAMKMRALLNRYAFLVGALTLALVLVGMAALSSQATCAHAEPAATANQPAPALTVAAFVTGRQSGRRAGLAARCVGGRRRGAGSGRTRGHLRGAVRRYRRRSRPPSSTPTLTAGERHHHPESNNAGELRLHADAGGQHDRWTKRPARPVAVVFGQHAVELSALPSMATARRSSAARPPARRSFGFSTRPIGRRVTINDLTIKNGAVKGADGARLHRSAPPPAAPSGADRRSGRGRLQWLDRRDWHVRGDDLQRRRGRRGPGRRRYTSPEAARSR